MQITMQGKYQTEDGRPVEILRTGLYYDGPFNVLGIIWQGDGKCIVEAWTPNGKTTHKGIYNNDLVPVPTKHEGWAAVSVSRGWIGTVHKDILDAIADAKRQTESHDAPRYYVTRVYESED